MPKYPFSFEDIPIDNITIKDRHRRDLGDLEGLAASMKRLGQLQPVGLNEELEVVYGERRVRAAMLLGWNRIWARIGDFDRALEAEYAENNDRLDFSPVEAVEIGRALEAQEEAAAAQRKKERQFKTRGEAQAEAEAAAAAQDTEVPTPEDTGVPTAEDTEVPTATTSDTEWDAADSKNKTAENRGSHGGENFSSPQEGKGKAVDIVAKKLGMSGITYRKARAVMAAAEEDPSRFQPLVDQMQRTKKVSAAYNKLQKALDEDRVKKTRIKKGKFRTLVIDPPWDMDWISDSAKAAQKYATMTLDEIADLNPRQWVDLEGDGFAHLYLWAPNVFVGEAWRIMTQEWGFEYRTLITWDKARMGQGAYFRNATEQILFGTIGKKKTTRVNDIPTVFQGHGGVDEHSVKPDEFYDFVMRASHAPYGEAFQRKKREGFESIYEITTEQSDRFRDTSD